MELRELGPEGQKALEQTLGYLNYSSGASDPQFLVNLNLLYQILEAEPASAEDPGQRRAPEPAWRTLHRLMQQKLEALGSTSVAFQDITQAREVLQLGFEHLLPEYRQFHRDLLFHQNETALFRPLFVGRAFEAVLVARSAGGSPAEIVQRALQQLNDYVGYRPVAVLENRRCEPYPHERLRPVPLYIREVGVSAGPYHEVVQQALELLRQTNPAILRAASFDPQQLDELALDPRAYDFDHPVNKRPNYHFGQWDPHRLDERGNYCRFVVQQVTIDSLMHRVVVAKDIPRDERVMEAAAVLAGTILMASGVSGSRPDHHDSQTTLGTLLPSIAAYRDAFYEQLLDKLPAAHGQRLQREARQLRQPFGAARQHLNAQLTKRRAAQLEHVRLASVFARMGYPHAAQRQIDSLPVASARILCQIDCNLTSVQRSIEQRQLDQACQLLRETRQWLHRGIECGAIIDPWNILGFDGNFSLFPALENSVHDHRVDELIDLMDELFDHYSRLWSAAAATDDQEVWEAVSTQFHELVMWWHQFATHEISSVDTPDPLDVYNAAESVARALHHWHQGGEATGDVGFWAPHVQDFDSPRAYTLVLETLLEKNDLVAAMALLVHWLEHGESVPLEQGDNSFHKLALQWLTAVLQVPDSITSPTSEMLASLPENWKLVRKFFDYLEANAGPFWQVPDFPVTVSEVADTEWLENSLDEDEDETEDLYSAAYEDVVYRDSTDDGIEGELFETGSDQPDHLDLIHDEIVHRLLFFNCLSRLWKTAVAARALQGRLQNGEAFRAFDEVLPPWSQHVQQCRTDLEKLLDQVSRYRLTRPQGDYLSMAEFDRQRMIKESLLEHVIMASVELAETGHFVAAASQLVHPTEPEPLPAGDDEVWAVRVLQAALAGDRTGLEETWPLLVRSLEDKPILYVPLARGGNPRNIITVRIRQQTIRLLLAWLPRLGLLTQTRQLIELTRRMERSVPAGPGAVTEFDDLFDIGYRGMVECLIRATNVDEHHHLSPSDIRHDQETNLVSSLEYMTESLLIIWLSHSRTLRLSVLEKVKNADAWQRLVRFIKRYGRELFSQQFLSLANLRAILYQGVDSWLEQLEEAGHDLQLLTDLGSELPRDEAVRQLTLILEAIVENYAEYRDYNSTTTQSDRGDLLYNLLDFLRLLSNYERIVWNLKPVVLSHEILVRHGCNEAAQMWRRALAERIGDEADRYIRRLIKLQQRYAMQLPTIADRVSERFLRPMIIDRMRALVEPSMERANEAIRSKPFELLEEEAALLMREPSGVGFDAPAWLMALEEEVHRVRRGKWSWNDNRFLETMLPATVLSVDEVQQQLNQWGPRKT